MLECVRVACWLVGNGPVVCYVDLDDPLFVS